MKSRRIIIGAVAGLIGAAVLGLFIVLPMLVKPESFRTLLQEELTKALKGRQVEIGKISLDFWPGIGLQVDNFKVADLVPGQPFISSGNLVVRAALMPLLSRRLVVKQVELDSPALSIVKLKDGKWNFSDLASTEEKPDSGAPQGELTIRTIVINNAAIELTDQTGALAPLRLDLHTLALDNVYTNQPMTAALDASVAQAPGHFRLDAVYGPLSAAPAERKTELTVAFDQLDLKAFLAVLPVGKLPVDVRTGTLSGSVSAKPTSDLSVLDADIKLAAAGFSYTNPEGKWPVSEPADVNISGHARYDQTTKTFTLDDGVIAALGNSIGVTVRNEPAGPAPAEGSTAAAPTRTQATVSAKGVNLDNLLRLAPVAGQPLAKAGLKVTGPADLSLTYTGVTGAPANLKAAVDLTPAAFAIPGSIEKPAGTAGALSSDIVLGDKSIDLNGTVVRLGPLTLNGGGAIGKDPLSTANLRLEGGPADTEALKSLFPSLKGYELGGQMSVGVEVSGPLSKSELLVIRVFRLEQRSEIASFAATAEVRLTKPMQVNFNLDGDMLNLDRMLKPDPAAAPAKKESSLKNYAITGRVAVGKAIYKQTDVSAISGNLSLKQAQLSIPDLKLSMLGGSMSGPVSLDLGREALAGNVSANLGGFMIDGLIKKFTTFPVVVTGEATGNLALGFVGSDAGAIAKTAKGNGKIKLNNGELRGLDLVNGLIEQWAGSPQVKELVRQNLSGVIKRNVGESTPFKDLSAELDLATGKIKLQRAVIDISEGEVEVTGTVGLDRSVDLRGRTRLSKEVSQRLMAQVKPWIEKQSGGQVSGEVVNLLLDDGRLILPFSLKGAWPKPTLLFDAQGYNQTVKKNLKNQTPEQLLETVVGKEKKEELERQAQEQINRAVGDIGRETQKAIGKEASEALRGIIPGFPAAEEPKTKKKKKDKTGTSAGSTTTDGGATAPAAASPAPAPPPEPATPPAPPPAPAAPPSPPAPPPAPAPDPSPEAPSP